MLRAFGHRCQHIEPCATPVGAECLRCGVAIGERDEGFTMPLVHSDGTVGEAAYHRACHLESLGVTERDTRAAAADDRDHARNERLRALGFEEVCGACMHPTVFAHHTCDRRK